MLTVTAPPLVHTVPLEEWITVGEHSVYLTSDAGDIVDGVYYPYSFIHNCYETHHTNMGVSKTPKQPTWDALVECVERRARCNPPAGAALGSPEPIWR